VNELIIIREIIPWDRIIRRLSKFYDQKQGPVGKSLRTMIALQIIKHFRKLSDRDVVKQVKENRYIQYFCNVADEDLHTFLHPSSLCVLRKRLGTEGAAIIEEEVFNSLRQAGVITGESALMDSTVLESNIAYPNDIQLIINAFGKMAHFAKQQKIPIWWDDTDIKESWREFNLKKRANRPYWLSVFFQWFVPALMTFKILVNSLPISDNPKKQIKSLKKKEQAEQLHELLLLLGEQTAEKLDGVISIENRIVSLDEVDARPIKKGKINPSCEFGTTLQMTFSRTGFMVTAEVFIGKPNDTTLFPSSLAQFINRMKNHPDMAITDLGYRSKNNFQSATKQHISNVFLGRSADVTEEKRDYCRRARSATEGFIAVAKNIRGFGCSLYKEYTGDRIWTSLSQIAYNLKKFIQLWQKEEITEDSLIKLGFIC
jgi:IS5 family transposase